MALDWIYLRMLFFFLVVEPASAMGLIIAHTWLAVAGCRCRAGCHGAMSSKGVKKNSSELELSYTPTPILKIHLCVSKISC
jgi:hypothetical protein